MTVTVAAAAAGVAVVVVVGVARASATGRTTHVARESPVIARGGGGGWKTRGHGRTGGGEGLWIMGID